MSQILSQESLIAQFTHAHGRKLIVRIAALRNPLEDVSLPRFFYLTAAMLFVAGLGKPCIAQESPSYDECVSAYQANLRSLMPFLLEMEKSDKEFPAALTRDIDSVSTLREILRHNLKEDDREKVTQVLEDIEVRVSPGGMAAREAGISEYRFVWTDGVRFQVRTKPNPSKGFPEFLKDAPPVQHNLKDAYKSTVVISFVPRRDPLLRIWTCFGGDGVTPTAIIASRNLQSLHPLKMPPLGNHAPELANAGAVNPLEMWMFEKNGVTSTEMTQLEDGTAVVLLRRAFAGPEKRIDRFSAWLDPAKGYIPVKFEHTFSGGDLTPSPSPEYPTRLESRIQVSDIIETQFGFYPREIVKTDFEIDPVWHKKQEKITFHDVTERIAVRESVYKISNFIPRSSLPEDSINFELPIGTRYLDQDTNQLYLVGTTKEEFDRQLVTELTGQSPSRPTMPVQSVSSSGISTFAVANIIFLVVIALLTVYLRRSRSR